MYFSLFQDNLHCHYQDLPESVRKSTELTVSAHCDGDNFPLWLKQVFCETNDNVNVIYGKDNSCVQQMKLPDWTVKWKVNCLHFMQDLILVHVDSAKRTKSATLCYDIIQESIIWEER